MRNFDPKDWYWEAEDGRLFSSKTGTTVADTSAAYASWLMRNGFPTPWPKDENGKQTNEALNRVLSMFGRAGAAKS